MQRGIKPLQPWVHSLSVYRSLPRLCVGTIAVLWRTAADEDWVGWAAQRPGVSGGSTGASRCQRSGPGLRVHTGLESLAVLGGSPSPAGAKDMDGAGGGRRQSFENQLRV